MTRARDGGTAPARASATVVLLRDGPGGLEAYLQRRPRAMGFAGGLWVFPGGRVDERDADPSVDAHWSGPPPAAWARRLGLDVDGARGHVVAACRETLEEAGVLLCDPAAAPDALAAGRRALLGGERGLAALLARLRARLATGRLRYWGWWVTPAVEPRRYDTRFFVAAFEGGEASVLGAEVEGERWLAPAEAARDWSLPMLPPTRLTLRELAAFASVGAVLAAGAERPVQRVLPVLEGDVLIMPWGERYPVPEPG